MKSWLLPIGLLFFFFASACNNANVQVTGMKYQPKFVTPPTFSVNAGEAILSKPAAGYILKARVNSSKVSLATDGSYVLKNGVVR
jgi:hypothetical protein